MEKKTNGIFDEVLEAIDLFSAPYNSDLFTDQGLIEKDVQKKQG